MKRFFTYGMLATTLVFASCGSDNKKAADTQKEEVAPAMADLAIAIDGMTCAKGCALPIQKMLSETEGVQSAEVDFDKKAAFISYDKNKVTPAEITALFKDFKDGAYTASAATTDQIELRAKTLMADAKKKASEEASKLKKKAGDTKKRVGKKVTDNIERIEGKGKQAIETVKGNAKEVKGRATKAASNVSRNANQAATVIKGEAKKVEVKATEMKVNTEKVIKDSKINDRLGRR
ncbi:MAG: cation transporter [Flavobacteriales bacterium]|jgi:copper chaperone CopZ|nr:cation transporter [Flavobacteriales bacterium]